MKLLFYSGYIRNRCDLCRELNIDCHLSRKEAETAILLEGGKKWGHSLGVHLCGSFAAAFCDEQNKETFCLRDPFGKEALYYAVTENSQFICSNNLPDILTAEGYVRELNADALAPYLELGYLPGEMTFFKGIKMLLPAHYLVWNGKEVITGSNLEERAEIIRQNVQEMAAEDTTAYHNCIRLEQIEHNISAENYYYALPWVMRYFDQPQTDPDMAAYMISLREPTRYMKSFLSSAGADAFFTGGNHPEHGLTNELRNISQLEKAFNIDIFTPFCDAGLPCITESAMPEYHMPPEKNRNTDFRILIRDWMTDARFIPEIKARLSGTAAQRFFEADQPTELWDHFISGDESLLTTLYRIYVFLLWYGVHFENEGTKWMITTKSIANVFLIQDYETGEVLYEENSDVRLPIGSITKLAAALVVTRHITEPENTYITVTEAAIASIRKLEPAYAGFQKHIGRTFSCLELLYGALVSSGCEAVVILADYVSHGNMPGFIAEMNDAVQKAGCKKTFFFDACGLLDEGKSTAGDVALVLKEVIKNPVLKRILSTSFHVLPFFEDSIMTTNWMLNPRYMTANFCPYCVCGKTGTTALAGMCVSALFERNEKKYIAVVFNEDYTIHPNGAKMLYHTCKEAIYRVFESTGSFIHISLSEHYLMLPVGETYVLKPEVILNTEKDEVRYTFFSSNERIASVDTEGVVTVIGEGIVQLTVMTQTGDYDLCFLNSTGQIIVDLTREELPFSAIMEAST